VEGLKICQEYIIKLFGGKLDFRATETFNRSNGRQNIQRRKKYSVKVKLFKTFYSTLFNKFVGVLVFRGY
jgi:hypothetical protein